MGHDSEQGSDDDDDADDKCRSKLKDEWGNIMLLMFLYVLQGIPLGLSSSVSFLLQEHNVTYQDQAMYSFANWPFSIKLLWAPVVDSCYFDSLGRRKSWLIPVQYLIGIVMIVMAVYSDHLLADNSVNILLITASFLVLNILAATQDIAVDGWALTMLSRRNISWASTCNTVGQSAGYLLGNVIFLALESTEFCNKYLRSEPRTYGIITLKGFLYFWGCIFWMTTTLLMMFKSERRTKEIQSGVIGAYQQLLQIIRLIPVRSLIILLLTSEIGFCVAETVTYLKLIEAGVAKEHMALMSLPLMPIEVLLPLLITKHSSGPRPIDFYLRAFPYRLIICLEFGVLVWLAAIVKSSMGELPSVFYLLVLTSMALQQIASSCMFVTLMAFFSRISDPAIGGTYMTLLNTVSNLGVDWPSTLSLWFADWLTWKGCQSVDSGHCVHTTTSVCSSPCTLVDGYYLELCIAFLLGLLWLYTQSRHMRQLQNLPLSDWSNG